MPRRLVRLARGWLKERSLPPLAREELARDRSGVLPEDPGTAQTLSAVMDWLATAQDMSASADGGVARHYSLIDGWSSSYPETTGYIIPTFFDYAQWTGDARWRERAIRMADWLVSIQLPDGAFQGGKIDSRPLVPVTFNTGQILLGLAAAHAETGRYEDATRRAAQWLAQTQEPDGSWRSHESPFAAPGDKQYETHVAWGLFEAARVLGNDGFREAGLRNVHWALRGLPEDGWFDRCSLSRSAHPITHTLGYALRGVIEAYRASGDVVFRDAALRTARSLRGAMHSDGFLPGKLNRQWRGVVDWACLTGTAQIAICWTLLDRLSASREFHEAVELAHGYLRRRVAITGAPSVRGGVRGAFPIDGGYGAFAFLNWAAKFLGDSLLLEIQPAPPQARRSLAATVAAST